MQECLIKENMQDGASEGRATGLGHTMHPGQAHGVLCGGSMIRNHSLAMQGMQHRVGSNDTQYDLVGCSREALVPRAPGLCMLPPTLPINAGPRRNSLHLNPNFAIATQDRYR